jgi:hypothetical protein
VTISRAGAAFAFRTGDTLARIGLPGLSLPFLRFAQRQAPRSARVHGELGASYGLIGDYTNAARHFEVALSLESDAHYAFWSGIYAIKTGDIPAARRALMLGVELDSKKTETWLVGYVLPRGARSLDVAIKETDELIAQDPDNPLWWRLRVQIWHYLIAISDGQQHRDAPRSHLASVGAYNDAHALYVRYSKTTPHAIMLRGALINKFLGFEFR